MWNYFNINLFDYGFMWTSLWISISLDIASLVYRFIWDPLMFGPCISRPPYLENPVFWDPLILRPPIFWDPRILGPPYFGTVVFWHPCVLRRPYFETVVVWARCIWISLKMGISSSGLFKIQIYWNIASYEYRFMRISLHKNTAVHENRFIRMLIYMDIVSFTATYF